VEQGLNYSRDQVASATLPGYLLRAFPNSEKALQ
jgi:hypothetical protein